MLSLLTDTLRLPSQVVVYAPRLKDFRLFCIPDPKGDDSEAAVKILHGHYLYLVVKIVDLLDTVCACFGAKFYFDSNDSF